MTSELTGSFGIHYLFGIGFGEIDLFGGGGGKRGGGGGGGGGVLHLTWLLKAWSI